MTCPRRPQHPMSFSTITTLLCLLLIATRAATTAASPAAFPVLPAFPIELDNGGGSDADLAKGFTVALNAVHQDVRRDTGTTEGAALDARATGNVAAGKININKRYTMNVTLGGVTGGQAGQTFAFVLDTGSYDFWVYGPSVPAGKAKHGAFDSGKDGLAGGQPGTDKYWRADCQWSLAYVDDTGAAGAQCTTTQISWAGATTFTMTQTVLIANKITQADGYEAGFDGFIGLGWKTGDLKAADGTTKLPRTGSFFDELVAQKLLDNPVIGFYLPYNQDASVDFGFNNAKHRDTADQIHWCSVDHTNDKWTILGTGIQPGTDAKTSFKQNTVIDTGTTLFYFDHATAAGYYSNLADGDKQSPSDTNHNNWLVRCSQAGKLRDLSLWLGDPPTNDPDRNKITIDKFFMNWNTYQDDDQWCIGGVQERGDSQANVIGAIFFNQYYGVFDRTDRAERFWWSRIAPYSFH